MDKSEKYIKMCGGAKEIQELWEEEYCDIIYHKLKQPESSGYEGGILEWVCDCHGNEFPDYRSESKKWIWLPRQDQLQNMLIVRGFSWLLITFFQFCQSVLKEHNWLTGEVKSELDSLEKLWLAFVMKEKFNKKWEDGEWIKTKNEKG